MEKESYTLKDICEGFAERSNIDLTYTTNKFDVITVYKDNELFHKFANIINDQNYQTNEILVGFDEDLYIFYCSFDDKDEIIKNPEANLLVEQ